MVLTPKNGYYVNVVFDEYLRETAASYLEQGRRVALATITKIVGSSSRPLGSRMVITEHDQFFGSVSGGCVEKDVYGQAEPLLNGGAPRLLEYGKVEDPLLEIGLNCDGRIEVLLEPLTTELLAMLNREVGSSLVTSYSREKAGRIAGLEHRLVPNGDAVAGLGARREADLLKEGLPVSLEREEGVLELYEPRVSPPLLLIVGAETVGFPLARLAKSMGYRVVVTDARGTYARAELFPAADEVICAWPRELPEILGTGPEGFGERCYVVSLNHEERFEDDLFRTLMTVPAPRYLGCIGKRKRQEERELRQERSGYDLSELPRIHTPIGLDLGGKAPEDIALSIMAEVHAHRHGATAEPLTSKSVDRGEPAFFRTPL